MVSISNKKFSFIVKTGLKILLIYTLGFLALKALTYYQITQEKNELVKELKIKKAQTKKIKEDILISKKNIETVQDSYIKKEEFETKVKDIFKRMSIFDYNLKYLDSKKMCIDRYILIAQLTAKSESGLKAGEGILSYIGEVQNSQKNKSVYYINYISESKKGK